VRLPPEIPTPDRRKTEHGFAWLFFLTGMNQAQVDALRFGVNPHDDAEWASFVKWYKHKCQKPASEHVFGTVFPLSPEELRDRLRRH